MVGESDADKVSVCVTVIVGDALDVKVGSSVNETVPVCDVDLEALPSHDSVTDMLGESLFDTLTLTETLSVIDDVALQEGESVPVTVSEYETDGVHVLVTSLEGEREKLGSFEGDFVPLSSSEKDFVLLCSSEGVRVFGNVAVCVNSSDGDADGESLREADFSFVGSLEKVKWDVDSVPVCVRSADKVTVGVADAPDFVCVCSSESLPVTSCDGDDENSFDSDADRPPVSETDIVIESSSEKELD